jgi:hypothetical protein
MGVRETPRFDGQDQRRADASGGPRFGPKPTIGLVELGVRRDDAALPDLLRASSADQTMRHALVYHGVGRSVDLPGAGRVTP